MVSKSDCRVTISVRKSHALYRVFPKLPHECGQVNGVGKMRNGILSRIAWSSGLPVTELNSKIYHEQIRMIYQQGPVLIAGAMLCAILVTMFLWQHLPQSALLFWLAAVGITTVLRICIILAYLKVDAAAKKRLVWGPYFWLGTLAAGMIWGAWPLMFYQLYSTEYLLLVSTIFAGLVAVSAASGSMYLPAFVSFSMPLVIPLAVTHLLSGNGTLVLTGILILIFLVVHLFLALRGNRQYRELIGSRFENLELMERLADEKRIAERAVIAKSRFLAAASHDLRQPLHAMGMFLSALRNREEKPDQLHIINDMSKSAEALNDLFSSLLDVSRLDAEIIEINPVHTDARTLFDRIHVQFMQQAKNKNLKLVVHECQSVFYTDAILLERVLRNLFSNAVQYTVQGSVTMSCKPLDDGTIRIALSDTGIGIPIEAREDVFSEYYQLKNPERDRGKGLGLGLAIVKRLCELMDLPLGMHSEEGEGTTFTIDVPAGDPAQIVYPKNYATPVEAVGRRVLVIDDEHQVLQSMRHMLEGWGCQVMLAESARDALKIIALSDETPDVIFSDYRLPDGFNGIDAVEAIRESLETSLPAVVITGDTSPERLKEVSSTGLQVLHKPVSPDDVLRLLQELLPTAEDTSATIRCIS